MVALKYICGSFIVLQIIPYGQFSLIFPCDKRQVTPKNLFKTSSDVSAFSIKCWDCRSSNDPKCADPFDNSTVPITDCVQEKGLSHLPGIRPTMCRKIRQKGKAFVSLFPIIVIKAIHRATLSPKILIKQEPHVSLC